MLDKFVTDGGMMVRIRADEIREIGRNTQGVTLVRVQKGEQLVALARLAEADIPDDEDELDEDAAEGAAAPSDDAAADADASGEADSEEPS